MAAVVVALNGIPPSPAALLDLKPRDGCHVDNVNLGTNNRIGPLGCSKSPLGSAVGASPLFSAKVLNDAALTGCANGDTGFLAVEQALYERGDSIGKLLLVSSRAHKILTAQKTMTFPDHVDESGVVIHYSGDGHFEGLRADIDCSGSFCRGPVGGALSAIIVQSPRHPRNWRTESGRQRNLSEDVLGEENWLGPCSELINHKTNLCRIHRDGKHI